MTSRRFVDLDPTLQRTVLRVCLPEPDLAALTSGGDRTRTSALSEPVRRRVRLRRACRADDRLAQRLGDRLDLTHLDTLVLVASLEPHQIEPIVQEWIDAPSGRTLPGLLWGLLSDGRNRVHALGVRLAHEAEAAALGRFVES